MRTETGQVFRLEDYRPPEYGIDTVDLVFRLDAKRTLVSARLGMRRIAETPQGAPLVLDGDELEFISLSIDGAKAEAGAYTATAASLTLHTPPAAERFMLDIETAINPSANTKLMGLYRSNGVYCTQCEAEGFRRITYYLDRPDVLARWTVRIEADKATSPLLLSNGNPAGSGDLGDGRHYAVWVDPHPKPAYLFALVAGDLGRLDDSFVTESGRDVALTIFVEHGKEARATYAMDALKRSMRWDEERFGREYDLDVFAIVAVSDFNMGAMENKGLNVFNDKYVLADPQTASDADYANIEAIVAHEYFHNWTGNRVTCRDWFQLCLKEGLTVYRDHEFSADQRSRTVKRIAEVRLLKAHQFPEDAGPLAHPVRPREYREINNFYTSTVYEKGSELVRMIATILGESRFRAGLDLYFNRHDGEAATVEDFLTAFEDASGEDLSQFSLWYHQAGTPNLAISARHDAQAKTLTVEIEQSQKPTPGQSRKKPLHIPVRFGLVGADGGDIAAASVKGIRVRDGVMHVTKRRHTAVFAGVAEKPALSLLRGFSAPVTIHPEQPDEELAALAKRDSDPYTRWQSLQTLYLRALKSGARAVQAGGEARFDEDLAALALGAYGDTSLEPALRAMSLQLPSEADIGRELGENIDPDAIFSAREVAIAAIAHRGADAFSTTLADTGQTGPFSPDAASAGRRSLANTALDFLSVAEASPGRARSRYDNADNMTDMAAALTVLAHRFAETDEARDALTGFRQRFANEPIVLDKWFTVSATAPGAGALDTVQALSKDAAFHWDNPNRVRALLGAFATGNPTGFNRADGEAYRYFCRKVIELDVANPQLAARLLTAMRSWRSLEPTRREAARGALGEISAMRKLSADVRDIVERTLG